MKDIRIEGFWKSSSQPQLPEPTLCRDQWFKDNKRKIIASLENIQRIIRPIGYKGSSNCRICECSNGSEEYSCSSPNNPMLVYKWPSGFIHYIQEHNVCPSDNFLKDIIGVERKRVESKSETIIRLLKELSAEERLDLLTEHFCQACFEENNPCYCTRDD